jgi:pimeloyl-ACP methyl ester carboxylesterase
MDSHVVEVNGLELAYDTFGAPGDPTVVLVMGLGTARWAWPDRLCEDIASAGRHVVRFDNRDAGESTKLDHLGDPDGFDVLVRRRAPYSIQDMADDLLGLIDALGLGAVHLVGASMGGFIAQTAVIADPARFRTLTLIMSSTGSRRVGRPAPKVVWHLLRRRPARERAAAIEQRVETFRLIGSSGFAFDEDWTRELAAMSYDRAGADPIAYRRQLAAILTQPDRTRDLGQLQVPTLVIHGLHDPLVHASGGLALARAIPRSTFVGYTGMGHDLPRPLWRHFARDIVDHTGGAPVRADTTT